MAIHAVGRFQARLHPGCKYLKNLITCIVTKCIVDTSEKEIQALAKRSRRRTDGKLYL